MLLHIHIHNGDTALGDQQLKGMHSLGVRRGGEAEVPTVGELHRQHGELADIFHFPDVPVDRNEATVIVEPVIVDAVDPQPSICHLHG